MNIGIYPINKPTDSRQEGNVIAGAGHSWFGKVVNLNTAFLMEWIPRAFVDNIAVLTEGDPTAPHSTNIALLTKGDPYRTSFYNIALLTEGDPTSPSMIFPRCPCRMISSHLPFFDDRMSQREV